ncbi:MAG: hypothetical protein LBE85_11530 [Candidatus Accumulibacter sp.]|jgi:hypothetical protein|nr:hypothetical protein [Accumulibacter sp.]
MNDEAVKPIYVAVACRNASGMADLPVLVVTATPNELSLGLHYDRAEALAHTAGYEGPFVCFDADEQSAILKAALQLVCKQEAGD